MYTINGGNGIFLTSFHCVQHATTNMRALNMPGIEEVLANEVWCKEHQITTKQDVIYDHPLATVYWLTYSAIAHTAKARLFAHSA